MHLTYLQPYMSFTETPVAPGEELPDFIVLSGPNGSGKSNLMAAIHNGAIAVNSIQYQAMMGETGVRYVTPGALVGVGEGPQAAATFRGNWTQLQDQVNQFMNDRGRRLLTEMPAELFADQLADHLANNTKMVTVAALDAMITAADKALHTFTVDDFRRFSPLLLQVRDPFAMTLGEVFLTYHSRDQQNRFIRFQEKEAGIEAGSITDEEFRSRYGPPPWELMTATLDVVGLPYHFVTPPLGMEDNLTYEAMVVHNDTGLTISSNNLSTGERTLLAIAMSLYVGTNLSDSIRMPDVLLLDEADATLHPSMIKSLLNVLAEVFVNLHGVKVILTTHSPTTVALAPEESLYLMSRSGSPRMRAANDRDEALKILTVGLPTLSVKVENRRQVFVESEYDEECYQELFTLAKPNLDTELSLQFIASGKGGQGNSIAVTHLVSNLRNAGNDSVYGIVDRDAEEQTLADGVLSAGERYSLENYLLDPVPLGLLLLREQIVAAEDLGLDAGTRHLQVAAGDWQSVADAVAAKVASPDADTTPREVTYAGGTTISLPAFWLDQQGHSLEERILEVYPGAHRFQGKLKLKCISLAMGDVPECIPAAQLDLFRRLLAV